MRWRGLRARPRFSPETLDELDRLSGALDRFARIMLTASAVVVLLGGAALIVSLPRQELLTRLLVAIIATLALGALDGRYRWLQGRRYLLRWDPGEAAYFRSILITFGLVVCAGAALIGLAMWWP